LKLSKQQFVVGLCGDRALNSAPNGIKSTIMITRNTFWGTWYLPHSHVHN